MGSAAEARPVVGRAYVRSAGTPQDRAVIAACLVLVVGAELTFLAGGLVAGTLAGLVALAILLIVGSVSRDQLRGRVAIALAVLPLLRVVSIAVPSLLLPTWLWHALIGGPVLVATILAAVSIGLTPRALGLRRAAPPVVVTVAAISGFGVGLVAFLLAGPEAGTVDRAPLTLLGATIAVVVGGALAEELLFRGLIQQVAEEVIGGYGFLVSAALCALLYVASANPPYILLMALVAIGLGQATHHYRSLLPAATCHGVLLWSQLILWPILLG